MPRQQLAIAEQPGGVVDVFVLVIGIADDQPDAVAGRGDIDAAAICWRRPRWNRSSGGSPTASTLKQHQVGAGLIARALCFAHHARGCHASPTSRSICASATVSLLLSRHDF
jgi:hypothetical protein